MNEKRCDHLEPGRTSRERCRLGLILQALLCLVATVVAFGFSLFLCDLIPGTGVRAPSVLAEWVLATVIVFANLGLWWLGRFRPTALVLGSGFVAAFVVIVFFFFGGGLQLVADGFTDMHWGMLTDLLIAWRDTALPVLFAGIVSAILQALARRR